MKLIHTADIHLDTSFAGAGMPPAFGNRRRQAQRDTFRAICAHAATVEADALLIAGDLFEHDRVSRDTLTFLHNAFEQLQPMPVCIAPGNHDPCVQDSPYRSEAWPANVQVFDRIDWTSYALDAVPLTVHGFGFDGFDVSRNPFGSLRVPEDDRVHVAVAHGSERGHLPPHQKLYAPFDGAGAAAPGLHYLALGHFHTLTEVQGAFDMPMWYPGSPEALNFKETGPRHFLEVEIDPAAPHAVQVTPRPCGQMLYRAETLTVDETTTTQLLVDTLRGWAEEGDRPVVARVRLAGAAPPELRAELGAVQDAARPGYAFLDLVDETEPLEDYWELAQEQTSLGLFLARINAEIDDEPDAQRRQHLVRARELGLAAYRNRDVPVRGLDAGTT